MIRASLGFTLAAFALLDGCLRRDDLGHSSRVSPSNVLAITQTPDGFKVLGSSTWPKLMMTLSPTAVSWQTGNGRGR